MQDDFEALRPAHALLEHAFDVQALCLAHFSVLLVLAISTSCVQWVIAMLADANIWESSYKQTVKFI